MTDPRLLVSGEEILAIAKQLIAIESHRFADGQENAVTRYIQQILEKEGIDCELEEVAENRPNVYGFIPGQEKGSTLMFNGHTDTVPAFEMKIPPFAPVIREGRLYGRGSADMKGAVAAMLGSLIALKRGGFHLQKGLVFAGVIDEETSTKGTGHIVKNGPIPRMAVIGEPTDLCVCVAEMGMDWVEVLFKGKPAHASRPQEGINAIYLASEFIRLIRTELEPGFRQRVHPVTGEPTINIGMIGGGESPNIVADKCFVRLDRRWTPYETIESVRAEIESLASRVTAGNTQGSFQIKGMRELLDKPFATREDHPLVRSACAAVEGVTGKKRSIRSFPATSDAGLLSSEAGVDCIVLGPGNIDKAHSNDESIPVEDVVNAFRVYFALALDLCGR